MIKKLLLFLLLALPAFPQTVNTSIYPAQTGLNLGRNGQRWNLFAQNVDINGTLTVNGGPFHFTALTAFGNGHQAVTTSLTPGTTPNYCAIWLTGDKLGQSPCALLVAGFVPASEVASGDTTNPALCVTGGPAGLHMQACGGGGGGGDATSIQGNSVTAGSVSTPGQGYFVNSAGNSLELQTRATVDARDCAIPQDHVTDALASTNACIAAHPGATIVFPRTNTPGIANADYVFSGRIAMAGSQTALVGAAGTCSMQAANCVVFLFTAIDGGIDVGAGGLCAGCKLENIEFRGSQTSFLVPSWGGSLASNWLPCNPPANQTYAAGVVCVNSESGIKITSHFVTLENVIASRFGKHGIELDGTTAGDDFNFINTSALANHLDGFYIHGNNANAGSTLQSHAYYNVGYGFDDAGFLTNTHYSPQATNNHLASATTGTTRNISSYSCGASVCTVNTATAHNMVVGNALVQAGTAIDGTYFVASIPTSTQLTFALASGSSGAAAGTVRLASANEFYTATALVGGGYYIHSSNNSPVIVNGYYESGQTCDMLATTIIIGGNLSTCATANGVQNPALRFGQLLGVPAQISQSYLNVNKGLDANLTMIMRAGSTSSFPAEFKWVDFDATTIKWWGPGRGQIGGVENYVISEGAAEPFGNSCSATAKCRLQLIAASHTDINAQGSGAVRFNSDNSSGTGGVEFWNGAASAAKIASITNTGLATFNGGLTLPSISGSTQCLQVNSSGVVSGTASACFGAGVLAVVNGGTGTATPALVAGTNITITGTWPNNTINASGSVPTGFDAITSATNTIAAMVVGTGASLAVSGSGTIAATTAAALAANPTDCAANTVANVIAANGNLTCVSVAGSYMVNNTVTATQLAAQYSKWLVCVGKGLGDGLNAIPLGTYLETSCRNVTGVTVTITGIQCFTDNNGTSTMNVTNGAGTSLLTGNITCTNSYAAGTQSATVTLAANDYLKFTFGADGTTKQTDWNVVGSY